MPDPSPNPAATLDAILNAAVTAHRENNLPEAERLYRLAIASGDACPGFALSNLGTILSGSDRLDEAIALYRASIAKDGGNASAHFNLGNALHRQGDAAGALESYKAAAAGKPGSADALFRAGLMAFGLGRHDEALTHFTGAATAAPARADIWFNAAITQEFLRRPDEAESYYRKSIAADPDFVEAANNLAALLIARRRSREAAEIFQSIVARRPDYQRAHLNLAKLAINDRPAEAEISARRALAIDPSSTEAMFVLANALTLLGRHDEAMSLLGRVRGTGSIELRYSSSIMGLPVIYDSDEQIESVRAAYRDDLAALAHDLAGSEVVRATLAETAIGNMHPFYLAYQQSNDRDLQAILGSMIGAAMATRYPDFAAPIPLQPMPANKRIRVGVASGYFRLHTIWKLFGGWFRGLDRSRFELFAYTMHGDRDERSSEILGEFDHAIDGMAFDFETLCRRIKDDALHVLIFPEIGMIPLSVRLAALRLAPVQCAAWGHPETTGLPTIDYFLTSTLMEPPDARDHYTETLVPLPGIGICYQPLDLPKAKFDRSRLGGGNDVLYLCAQSLYKYLPKDDRIYPEIAKLVPTARFVFIGGVGIAPFRRRLERAFAEAGLDAARHLIILSPLSQADYLGLNDACDVYLDSLGWSGGNTSFEAALAGLPIVTRPGPLMRGRHSAALLTAMGISETIAASDADYVAIAARLGSDPDWRAVCAKQMIERHNVIFNDRASVTALEDFIATKCVAD